MGFLKQGFSGALAAVMVLTSGGLCVGQSVTIHAETKAKTYEDYKKVLNYTAEYQGYEAYKEGLENVKRPETSYEINGADYVTCEGMEPEVLTDYEGMEGTSVYTEESGMLTYEVDIAEEGMYEFGISYYPVAGNGSSIQRSFFVDGELSYRELSLIEFSRVWVNTSDIWDEDNQGNDLKPTQMEAPEWLFSRFYDQDGYVTEPLSIFLTKGKHEITVVSRREPMILHSIYLQNEESLFDYKTVYEQQKKDGVSDTSGQSIEIQAEYATKKSSRMLYPVQDQSSPAITPYSAKELKNNSIGGNSWRLTGQWIEWEFDADADGFYNITLHSKQNFVKGIYVSRKIMIDGEVPFEELNHYGFTYDSTWKMTTLSDASGEPYRFYLNKGHHTLRMQVVLGDFAGVISDVQSIVTELNSEYRKIIRITGVSPDEYRDYQIEKRLPELEGELKVIRDELDEVLNGSVAAGVVHEFKKLFYSFIVDYNAIGNVAEEGEDSRTITVWIGSGRDQANVIKALIDETFTPETNINVNVQLVDMNTLLQATLAGQGPDVALQVANGTNGTVATSSTGTTASSNDLPVNYGLRSAVVDLTQFPDYEDVVKRFRESAVEPFMYDGALYALPETQSFEMMFYRKDILNELGIEIPKTWDDMKVVLSELSKNQMSLGMLPTELTFTSLLYQHDGELYNEDATASALDSDEAVNAFKTYCEFYTDYKLDRETSVEQRFRTGESPIIIADYTTYNVLEVSAPDIKGLWGFTALPGVKEEDGSINNISASTGLACMMMSGTKDKEASWEFMKWWLSAEIQTSYGEEMEGLMGEAARYPTANIEAFANLPWPTDDYEALEAQFANVKGIRQVPGSYFTWRNVNNAFYTVAVADEDKRMQPREALYEYLEYINAEITSKREEFGMKTASDAKQ